jgi:Family of unknown function (DUF5991)
MTAYMPTSRLSPSSLVLRRSAPAATLMHYRIIIAVVCLTLLSICQQLILTARADDINIIWQGTYEYKYNDGKSFGGSPIVEVYTLTISPEAAVPAKLTIQGFQTDEVIYGDTRGNPSEISILFHSYANGQIVNAYGVAQFKVGQVLVKLRKTGVKNITQIGTIWDAIVPNDKLSKTGLYFQKK